jgi:glycerophosphoryl diester phosphodiesterase
MTAFIGMAAATFVWIADSSAQVRGRRLDVQLGPRPFCLVEDMDEGPLKQTLQRCSEGPFETTAFSIGHRGAALQFPEHTEESYVAGARMGAGILECDVTFTEDLELVCRHAQCDLHTTTNILATPLAAKCSVPFTGAVLDPDGNVITPAAARCCSSDMTLAEFKTLKGKMDAFNRAGRTVQEYMDATPRFRTDLYSAPFDGQTHGGTLLTHAESIELFKELRVQFTPELKSPEVTMPFKGFTQQQYAQKVIDEYKAAQVPASQVWAQSFNLGDVLYWIQNEPAFGRQAVFLDDANVPADVPDLATLTSYQQQGVRIWAPPTWVLLALDANGRIVPSQAAMNAKEAGLDIITWTLERSGLLKDIATNPFYYQTILPAINNDGDMYEVLDVLAREVGVRGVFSDWAATVTYYDNCMSRQRRN